MGVLPCPAPPITLHKSRYEEGLIKRSRAIAHSDQSAGELGSLTKLNPETTAAYLRSGARSMWLGNNSRFSFFISHFSEMMVHDQCKLLIEPVEPLRDCTAPCMVSSDSIAFHLDQTAENLFFFPPLTWLCYCHHTGVKLLNCTSPCSLTATHGEPVICHSPKICPRHCLSWSLVSVFNISQFIPPNTHRHTHKTDPGKGAVNRKQMDDLLCRLKKETI